MIRLKLIKTTKKIPVSRTNSRYCNSKSYADVNDNTITIHGKFDIHMRQMDILTALTTESDEIIRPSSRSTFVSYPEQNEPSLSTRVIILIGILALSRLGVYVSVSSLIDTKAFAESLESEGGLMGYMDALSGGSIGRVGLFSLGIVPYINASIIIQLASSVSPQLKALQKDGGPDAKRKFSQYLKTLTLILAIAQGIGQLNYLRPFVSDFSLYWLFENSTVLAAGAIILTFFASEIDKLKLGNGTSLLVFSNILSSLPSSLNAPLQKSIAINPSNSVIFFILFLITVLGVVYVQDAERKIPINYASQYSGAVTGAIARNSYLPFKVNATGVMPIIFASSLLTLPSSISRFSDSEFLKKLTLSLSPNSPLYLLYNVGLIYLFNYLYTFIQFEPNDLSETLKKTGASIPAVRPGKATAKYLERTLVRLSLLGSAFLSVLTLAPSLVAAATGFAALGGYGGTSITILVGVATDFARRLRAEKVLESYKGTKDYTD